MLTLKSAFLKVYLWSTAIFTKESYRTKDSYFTRTTAKLTFERLICFILGNNRNSAQVALNDFFRNTEEDTVAKQTYFEAREKISADAFKDFNASLVDDFYKEPDVKTYKGFLLFGVDGSVLQLPQGALKEFGGQPYPQNETVSAQGRAVTVNDVLNRITVASSLKAISIGEREIAHDLLENMSNFKNSCYIFDRGFYSKKLCELLNNKSANFLFRIKSNCQKDIDKANKSDQIIFVDDLKLRVINVVLPTGEIEKLATNIFDENFSVEDFAEIYEKRWGIEVSYLMLKERLAIENFSSAKKQLILQDFYASIITYNLMEIGCMEQEAKRLKDGYDADCKNFKSANRNIVAHEVREILLSLLCSNSLVGVYIKIAKMQKIIYRFFKDVRPNRSKPRRSKFPSKKFPMNKKRNL